MSCEAVTAQPCLAAETYSPMQVFFIGAPDAVQSPPEPAADARPPEQPEHSSMPGAAVPKLNEAEVCVCFPAHAESHTAWQCRPVCKPCSLGVQGLMFRVQGLG